VRAVSRARPRLVLQVAACVVIMTRAEKNRRDLCTRSHTMIRRLSLVALGLLLAAPLAAQVPAGLRMRVDASTDASDPDDNPEVKIMQMGSQLHVTTGPAVVLWKDSDTATGTYTLKGTFTMLEPSGHRNFYGLVFGGRDLNGAGQQYTYFTIAQTGEYLIKIREGNAVEGRPRGTEAPTIKAATAHAAVVKPDASGRSVNTLEVRVGASQIEYVINGQVVHTTPKTGVTAQLPGAGRGQAGPTKQVTLSTDGIWGVRINHVLPGIVVENLSVTSN
jgi:hypothetical protein